MHALMHVLKENDANKNNPLPKQKALNLVEERLKKDNRLHEIDYTKNNSGYVRWENNLQFYFINLSKSNYVSRKRGQWWITDEGIQALKNDPSPDDVFSDAKKAYKKWAKDNPSTSIDENTLQKNGNEQEIAHDSTNIATTLEDAQGIALNSIKEKLNSLNPYEFQDLVASIIESTGWTIQEVAKKGPDGGIDIIATTDELGIQQPRLCVQVKHYAISQQKATSKHVAEIRGSIDQTISAGMLVCSSGFTRDAVDSAKKKSPHITLLDLNNLLTILEKNYDKLSSKGKNLLPLVPVYFIRPDEDE